VTTVDHKASHICVRTPREVRCAYMGCNAEPKPSDIARLDAEDAQRRATKIAVRWKH
jgi:hypothetical protein